MILKLMAPAFLLDRKAYKPGITVAKTALDHSLLPKYTVLHYGNEYKRPPLEGGLL
jgi:hypothetical protein